MPRESLARIAESMRYLIQFFDLHAGAIQAASTIVLVFITAYYAALTRRSVLLLRQERDDRIIRARVPLSNALLGVTGALDVLEGLINRRAPDTRWSDSEYRVMDATSRVARAADQVTSEALKMAAHEVTNRAVLIRTLLGPPEGSAESMEPLDRRLDRIPPAIASVRQAIAQTSDLLGRYVGP